MNHRHGGRHRASGRRGDGPRRTRHDSATAGATVGLLLVLLLATIAIAAAVLAHPSLASVAAAASLAGELARFLLAHDPWRRAPRT